MRMTVLQRGVLKLTFIITLTLAGYAQDREISLSKEQSLELRVLSVEYESAMLKAENARLKYVLAINQYKLILKLSDDYEFDQAKLRFVKPAPKPESPSKPVEPKKQDRP